VTPKQQSIWSLTSTFTRHSNWHSHDRHHSRHFTLAKNDLLYGQLYRWDAQIVAVAEKQNALVLAGGVGTWLNPLAPSCGRPKRLDESKGTASGISAIVVAHNRLDSFGGLIGMIKWNSGDVMMQYVRLNDTMEQLAADEAKLAINCGGSTAGIRPGACVVVGKSGVGMLQEGDGD
jgi:hypothetical protein